MTERRGRSRKTRRRLLVGVAALLVAGGYAVYRWLASPPAVIAQFQRALEGYDRRLLAELAHPRDRGQVLAQAEAIWALAGGDQAGENKTAARSAARTLVIRRFPASLLDVLRARRDFLTLVFDPKTGEVRDAFFHRVRAGYLRPGADPQKYQWLQAQVEQMLADPRLSARAGADSR